MKYLVFIFFIGLMMTACDQQGSTPATSPELYAKKLSFPFNTPKAKAGSLDKLREAVSNLITVRQKSMKEEVFDLTYYYITPQYISNNNVIDASGEFAKHWVKFENDYTFAYGIGPEPIGTGVYHYAPSQQRLIMLDDDALVEPKMWSILANSEFMNFLGHPLLLIRDRQDNEFLLMNNFANDQYINNIGQMVAEAHNGMQIKMLLSENAPE